MWTMQAPHRPAPHPNLVPVSLRLSRSTHSSGVSLGASLEAGFPFTVNAVAIGETSLKICFKFVRNSTSRRHPKVRDFRVAWRGPGSVDRARLDPRPQRMRGSVDLTISDCG